MGRLPSISGKEVCKILSKNGFKEIRRRGSHIVMQYKTEDSTVTIPVPDHKELAVGTLRSLIRQSGLSRKEFEK